MAHFLLVEVPGGSYGMVDHLSENGDTFVFITQELNVYFKFHNLSESPLRNALDIAVVHPYSYNAFLHRVTKLNSLRKLDGITCTLDFRIADVSRIALELGIPYLNTSTAKLTESKSAVREALRRAGIVQLPFGVAESVAAIRGVVESLGYPVVINQTMDSHRLVSSSYMRPINSMMPFLSCLNA